MTYLMRSFQTFSSLKAQGLPKQRKSTTTQKIQNIRKYMCFVNAIAENILYIGEEKKSRHGIYTCGYLLSVDVAACKILL